MSWPGYPQGYGGTATVPSLQATTATVVPHVVMNMTVNVVTAPTGVAAVKLPGVQTKATGRRKRRLRR